MNINYLFSNLLPRASSLPKFWLRPWYLFRFVLKVVAMGMGKLFRGLNRASEKIAGNIDHFLHTLTAQIQDGRTFVEREVWPEVQGFLATANTTLHHVDDVLEDAKETLLRATHFLDTSTLAVRILTKVIAIVLLVITVFVCRKILCKLSSQNPVNWLMKTVVEFLMLSCSALVLFLFYQLVLEFLGFEHRGQGSGSLNNVYIFIFPLLVVLAMLGHCIYYILLACAWAIRIAGRLLVYWPFYWALSPVIRGAGYYEQAIPWCYLPVYFAYPLVFIGLYTLYAIFCKIVLERLRQANHFPVLIVLTLYVISYIVFFAVHLVTILLISCFLRPLWAQSVRSKHTKRD